MKATSIAIAVAMVIPAADAYAQSDAIHPTAARSDALPCIDFQRNSDGSWTVIAPLVITNSDGMTVQISPSMPAFRNGTLMAGLDLGALLDQQCPAH